MGKDVFVGREDYLKSLELLRSKKSASLVVIKGRRRVGKSRLIQEYAKKSQHIKIVGLAPTEQTSRIDQIRHFTLQICQQLSLPPMDLKSWDEAFSILARFTKQGKVIISMDEISWIASKDHLFLSKLKIIWDEQLKQNSQLILILSGSISSWIEENILSSTGFFGRVSLVIDLPELSLSESNKMLHEIGFKDSAFEKFKILAVTGGIPRYIEEVFSDLSASENIKKLCFEKGGVLYREFDDIFSDLFDKKQSFYKRIVSFLASGSKNLSEIASHLELEKNGHVSKYLDHLSHAGFISKDRTWNIKSQKQSNLIEYRLSDNYLRFYLKYIGPNSQNIEKIGRLGISVSQFSSFDVVMGIQFENLVLNNQPILWNKLSIPTEDIAQSGPYFQRQSVSRRSCQIDCLIQTKTNILYICEVKFKRARLGVEVIAELEEKARKLVVPRNFSVRLVIIHVHGVDDNLDLNSSKYHISEIDFAELLEG